MAGTPKPVLRGASPIDQSILDTISKLVDDVEAVRAALVAHGAVAHGVVALPAADLKAYKLEG